MKAHVRHLGLQHYEDCLKAMQDFTRTRHKEDEDEIWLVEHPSVFTLERRRDVNTYSTRATFLSLQVSAAAKSLIMGQDKSSLMCCSI